MSDELDPEPMLGEVTDASRVYTNGRFQAEYPPATVIGNQIDFSQGELFPLALPVTLEGGWNSKCYILPPRPVNVPVEIDIRECDDQTKLADVLAKLYLDDGTTAKNQFLAYWPLTVAISWRSNQSDTLPGYVLAQLPNLTVMVIAGTRNFQQLALQALSALAGPTEFGTYATAAFWQNAAVALARIITLSGADPTKKIIFVGHSLGGAVACLLSVMFRAWSASRAIMLLTFGCPKPGDARLRALLLAVLQRHFINDLDVVTFMPPSGPDLGQIRWLIPPVTVQAWLSWTRPHNVIGLDINGTRTDNPSYEGVYSLIYRTVFQAVTGFPIETLTAHNMEEYARRVRCPGVPVPSPDPAVVPFLWLQGESLAPSADGDLVSFWIDSSLFGNSPQAVGSDTPGIKTTIVGPYTGCQLQIASGITLKAPLTPAGDYVLMVACAWTGTLLVNNLIVPLYGGPFAGWRLAWTTNKLGVATGNVVSGFTIPDTRNAIHLFQVRLQANVYNFLLDRVSVGTVSAAGHTPFVAGKVGFRPLVPSLHPTVILLEVLYLEGTIDPAEADQWTNQICDFYQLP